MMVMNSFKLTCLKFCIVLSIKFVTSHCIEGRGLTTSVSNDKPWRIMSCHQTEESCNAVISVIQNTCRIGDEAPDFKSLSISSVGTWSTHVDTFLNITWSYSGRGSKNQREPQHTLLMKLLISSVDSKTISCYIFTIDRLILESLNGQFSIPYINISSLESPLKISSTNFILVEETLLYYKPIFNEEIKIFIDKNISQIFQTKSLRYLVGEDVAVQIEFVPPTKPLIYTITLLEVSLYGTCGIPGNNMLQKIEGNSSEPSTTVSLSTVGLNPCGFYCAQVVMTEIDQTDDNCSVECASKVSETIFLPSVPTECNMWNVRMAVDYSTSLHEISVYFEPCCKTEHCFNEYEMFLIKLQDDHCNGVGIYIKDISFKMETNFNVTSVFSDVSPGNYCVKVRPIHPLCRISACATRMSDIVSVIESAKSMEAKPEYRPYRPYFTLASIAFIAALVLLISATVFCFFRKKIKLFRLVMTAFQDDEKSSVENRMNEMENISEYTTMITYKHARVHADSDEEVGESGELNSNQHTIYLFLHTFDKVTKDSVKNLICVLRKIAEKFKFPVTFESIEEQQLEISRNTFSWIQSHVRTSYSDVSGNVKRRIIVVESKRAVLHQKILKARFLGDRNLEEALEDQLYTAETPEEAIQECDRPYDKIFEEVLLQLTSLNSDTMTSYEHWLVHFLDSTPIDEKLLHVLPVERFYIPSCLFLFVKRVFNIVTYDPPFMEKLQGKLQSAMSENEHFRKFLRK